MNNLLIAPILIPLLTAIATMLARRRPIRRGLSVAGASLGFVAGALLLVSVQRDGIQVLHLGGWSAPFGITLVADLLSAIMVAVSTLLGVLVAVYALGSIDRRREAVGYHALFQVLLMGVAIAFLTGDLFNLYVSFEVMLMASFVLLALGGERGQLEGAVKYVTLNLLSSVIFLAACGIVYGITGTLNLADLSLRLPNVANQGLVNVVAMLLLVAFGIKGAIFPLFFWLPASYHTPPIPVAAIFAGLLTKVGVYALIRVFTLLFTADVGYTHTIILVIATITMLSGVLGAATQNDIRRILSFHIVSQIGYIVMGLALFTPLALAGAVFYLVHNIIAKTNLFLIGGVIERLRGSSQLAEVGGLYRTAPLLAGLFLISAFGLAGIPPLSGFWAKFLLVRAGFEAQQYIVVGVALVTSLFTLYSMTKIWAEAFWKDQPTSTVTLTTGNPLLNRLAMLPIIILAAITIAMGLLAEPFFALSQQAANQLLDPQGYVRAVLGR